MYLTLRCPQKMKNKFFYSLDICLVPKRKDSEDCIERQPYISQWKSPKRQKTALHVFASLCERVAPGYFQEFWLLSRLWWSVGLRWPLCITANPPYGRNTNVQSACVCYMPSATFDLILPPHAFTYIAHAANSSSIYRPVPFSNMFTAYPFYHQSTYS